MLCPECQFDNPAGSKFCNECGSKLDITCPNCSNLNPAGSKFCNECGHNLSKGDVHREATEPLPAAPAELTAPEFTAVPEGERRQATVVFSDLSGYTSMNEKFDPEEVEAVMSRIKQEAVRIVERHGGIVNQFVGDEVLALFGIPTAHEDDPVRAVRAARELHDLVRQISPEVEEQISTRLRMHSGISTGLVVTHLRDIRDGSYGITGDTVNISARLASHSETDEFFQKSITADETSGAVVLAARTQYYRADMLARKGETEPGRSLLHEIQQQFQGWGIPAWQLKCEQALQTILGD